MTLPSPRGTAARPVGATGATARGAAAIGALAVGAVAVGAAAVGRLAVGRATVRRLEIDELVVGDLQLGVSRAALGAWVDGYERAWRTPGTAPLSDLFAEEATYSPGPYEPTVKGLPAIGAFWEAGREGADEVFRMTSEIVALDGATGVVRVDVDYGLPVQRSYRNLWVVRFADDGRASAFEEWPFWPERPVAGGAPAPPAGPAA